MLQIRLLGEPEVLRDGSAVPLPASKKTRALLAYLAVTARPHLREKLCELLWEGPDDPRAALRWTLTKLRPVVGSHLVAGRDRVEFRRDGASVDIDRLGAPAGNATTGDLESCASLFRGELAEGLDLPGCFRFQQWCAGERERFRQSHVAILRELTERLGASERALTYARRRVQIDPFDENAHAALIRLLAGLGDRQEALAMYEHCRQLFERELGTRPGAAVEDARRSVGAAPHPAFGHPLPASRGEGAEDAKFVGREKEIVALEAARGAVIVLGEPGIGKSRLLQELRNRSTSSRYGRAFAAEMARPYGVWIDALEDFPTETDRARLFDAVVERLEGIDLLEIDDLQWIDESSAALLHYVARRSKTRVIAAARVGEIDDNAHASRLAREFRQYALGPMADDDLRLLVDDRNAVAQSGGNPLFALELARAQQGGTLSQVIASRLAQLDGRARDLVSWAAAIGRRFDADILGRATEMPSGEMLAALEKLERSAIVRVSESGGSYDFTHDLIRDGAYQAISGPRRILVHRHIARALQSVHDADGSLAGDIVRHASIAGDHAAAVSAAITAGERCLRLFAYGDAIQISRLGLDFAESLPENDRVKLQLKLLEVIVHSRAPIADRFAFAPRVTALTDAARALGLTKAAASGAYLLAVLHADSDHLGDAALQTIRSTDMIRNADPRLAAVIMATTARCLLFIEREIPRAQSLLGEVETIIGAVGGEHVEIPLGLGYLHAHHGDNGRAFAELQRAYDIAERDQDHWREWTAAARLVTLSLETRDFDAARRWCERLQAVAGKMKGGSEEAKTAVLASVLRYAADGREGSLRGDLEQLRTLDCKSELAWALVYVAEVECERGDAIAARRDAEEALRAAEAVGRAGDAAIARTILGLPIDRRKWNDLSARARTAVLARRKEKRNAQHGRGTDL